MSKSKDLFVNKNVSMYDNVMATRIGFKRDRTLQTDVHNSQTEKRSKRESGFIDEDEIRDKLLEEFSLNVPSQDSENIDENQQTRKIIEVKGALPNLALPEGWIALNHRSGGIIYLHRATRVCTWARPYYIGKGSVRKHDVPVAAIPCLHQAKALRKYSLETQKHSNTSVQNSLCPSNKHISVLNFLNTAGSNDNQMGEKSISNGNNVIQTDVIQTEVSKSTDNDVYGGILNNCTVEECDSVILDVDQEADRQHQKHGTNTKNVVDNFNPKDGLDVVNDTLNFILEGNQPKGTGSSPAPSLELNSTQSPLQSTNFSSILNQEPCNGTHSFEEGNILYLMPQSLKGDEKTNSTNAETVDDTTKAEEANFSGLAKQIDDEVNSKSSVTEFTVGQSKSDQKDNSNLLTTHNTTGIDLIEAEALSWYLSKLFEFGELTVQQEQNVIKPSDQAAEDMDSTLSSALECLPYSVKGKNAKENKGWVINPGGKTPVAILHEYCQAVVKEKPVYVYNECGNSAMPFMAEVQIDGITHGTGAASNKKQAKQIAAEVALEVLMPNAFSKIRDHVISREELECFDKLKIDSPNIYEVSIKSGLPTPSQVLQECLKRNQGVCSSIIHFKIVPGEYQNHTFKISCGKHSAEGKCKNKKIGKQLASQALLMKLHPHISTWGSLLRIYCDRPSSIVKKYKTPDKDSLSNCTSTPDTSRGQALLARLKEEMLKIAENGYQGLKYVAGTSDIGSISTVDI